ncbi:hypothetical protein EVAR_53269_1 [Eumeta japonica]|uniref:Uncharacterized protein n=1 Tax=Eumeta variegata TaxID=151549 RepID=A0A4C1YM41_EUMVA|nr:hypothetical protein EVAR_53269_1 [Eumeta japonica]
MQHELAGSHIDRNTETALIRSERGLIIGRGARRALKRRIRPRASAELAAAPRPRISAGRATKAFALGYGTLAIALKQTDLTAPAAVIRRTPVPPPKYV